MAAGAPHTGDGMNDEVKKRAAERYQQELRKGERFWPDSIYKDLLVSLGIFVLLVLLAALLFLPLMPCMEPNPAPHYGKRILPISVMAIMVVSIVTLTFMADYPTVTAEGSAFPGVLQAIAGLVIPVVGLILLFLMAFAFKNTPARTMIWTAGLTAALMVGFTGGGVCLDHR